MSLRMFLLSTCACHAAAWSRGDWFRNNFPPKLVEKMASLEQKLVQMFDQYEASGDSDASYSTMDMLQKH